MQVQKYIQHSGPALAALICDTLEIICQHRWLKVFSLITSHIIGQDFLWLMQALSDSILTVIHPLGVVSSTNGQLCMSRRRRAGAHDIVHDLSCQAPTVSKIEQHGSQAYELNRSSWQALSYSLSRCWSWGKPKVTSFLPYILIFSITAPKQMFNWRRADARDNNGNCSR